MQGEPVSYLPHWLAIFERDLKLHRQRRRNNLLGAVDAKFALVLDCAVQPA
jgi:hypothetical protein